MLCLFARPCPTLHTSTDCSPPGSFVHRVLQARLLEWVATSSSRGTSQSRDQTQVCSISCISRKNFYFCTTGASLGGLYLYKYVLFVSPYDILSFEYTPIKVFTLAIKQLLPGSKFTFTWLNLLFCLFPPI